MAFSLLFSVTLCLFSCFNVKPYIYVYQRGALQIMFIIIIIICHTIHLLKFHKPFQMSRFESNKYIYQSSV